jgi:hypothetical protein
MSVLRMLVTAALVFLVPAFPAKPVRRRGDGLGEPRRRTHRWESPHLESRDEYELTHDVGSPHLESRCEYEHRHRVELT